MEQLTAINRGKERLVVEEVEQSAQLHYYDSQERMTGYRYPATLCLKHIYSDMVV